MTFILAVLLFTVGLGVLDARFPWTEERR